MADIKINGNKYNGIERVKFVGADGMSAVSFMDASILENLITGTLIDEYHDSRITTINTGIFKSAKIGVINMPKVKNITYFQAFQGCTATEIRFAGLQTLKGSDFLAMGQLVKAVFGVDLTSLSGQMFNACSKLATIVLPHNGVVSIVTGGNASLNNTAIANGTGYVYVPSAQVDNYKADSSWSAYANQIRAIEDYPDEVA